MKRGPRVPRWTTIRAGDESPAPTGMTAESSPLTGSDDGARLSEPTRALSEFYRAFNNRDIDAMSRNWAHTEDVSMDNPLGGIKRGWDEIRAVYERIFAGPAKVRVEFFDYTLHQSGDVFYAVGRERGEFSVARSALLL